MLGLFVFFYATLHLFTYVAIDYRFDWEPIINDVVKKVYLYWFFSMVIINTISYYIFKKDGQITKAQLEKNTSIDLYNCNFWIFTLYMVIKNNIF